jgi:hypothetical protein
MGSPSQDIHAPKIQEAKKNVHKQEMSQLDDALENTFPASDPPAMTEPHRHLGSGKKTGPTDKNPGGSTGSADSKN